jgi:hypothetical protein
MKNEEKFYICAKCQKTLRIKQHVFYISDFQIDLTVGIDLSNFNKIIYGKLLKFAQKFWLKLKRSLCFEILNDR